MTRRPIAYWLEDLWEWICAAALLLVLLSIILAIFVALPWWAVCYFGFE